MRVKLLEADADGREPGAIVTMSAADAHQAAALGQVSLLGEETVSVRYLQTVEPTATDSTRYDADSVWQTPISRAEQLIDDGIAELTDGDAPPAPLNFSME